MYHFFVVIPPTQNLFSFSFSTFPHTEFLETYMDHVTSTITSGLWELDVLLDTIIERCICSARPPPAQVVVGLDSKFSMPPLRMLSPGWRQFIYRILMPKQIPAMFLDKAEKHESTQKDKKEN